VACGLHVCYRSERATLFGHFQTGPFLFAWLPGRRLDELLRDGIVGQKRAAQPRQTTASRRKAAAKSTNNPSPAPHRTKRATSTPTSSRGRHGRIHRIPPPFRRRPATVFGNEGKAAAFGNEGKAADSAEPLNQSFPTNQP
jgi:hypothetical protein